MAELKKMKPKFSTADESKLITLVEESPLLWDPNAMPKSTSEVLSISLWIPHVWAGIAEEIGTAFTALDVIAKFKNMKDTFAWNFRKVVESERSGVAAEDVYKPKWNLYERLLFLQRVCAQDGSISNVTPVETPSQPLLFYDETRQECFPMTEDRESPVSSDSVPSASCTASPLPSPSGSSCSASSFTVNPADQGNTFRHPSDVVDQPYAKRGRRKVTSESDDDEVVTVLKDIAAQRKEPVDRIDAFVTFIGSRLRLMSEERLTETEEAIIQLVMQR